ncbi:hypothetical protein WJX72_005020 [[Myrmecia] bisecta]|uniref:Uncharacterized protein n=1 Tax=[Myrmecia] bisecta TaxID=41462 RepID=A0AAW1PWV6_9CHLO
MGSTEIEELLQSKDRQIAVLQAKLKNAARDHRVAAHASMHPSTGLKVDKRMENLGVSELAKKLRRLEGLIEKQDAERSTLQASHRSLEKECHRLRPLVEHREADIEQARAEVQAEMQQRLEAQMAQAKHIERLLTRRCEEEAAAAQQGQQAMHDAQAKAAETLQQLKDMQGQQGELLSKKLERDHRYAAQQRRLDGLAQKLEDTARALTTSEGDLAHLEDRMHGLRQRNGQLEKALAAEGKARQKAEHEANMLEGECRLMVAMLRSKIDPSRLLQTQTTQSGGPAGMPLAAPERAAQVPSSLPSNDIMALRQKLGPHVL